MTGCSTMSSADARLAAAAEVRSCSDGQLVARMRAGDVLAWGEFAARFRTPVEAFARRIGIPSWEWEVCITEVLDDEAMRLASPAVELPTNLGAYLTRASYHRYLRLKRARACRERNYTEASGDFAGERVVGTLCSEHAVRACDGAMTLSHAGSSDEGESPADVVGRLARAIEAKLTEEEQLVLAWVGQGVPHRQIAEWLGSGYDATTKRIWRLCRRVREAVPRHLEQFSGVERREVERFFRRAGESACAPGNVPAGSLTSEATQRDGRGRGPARVGDMAG